jgi:hypothetical protein
MIASCTLFCDAVSNVFHPSRLHLWTRFEPAKRHEIMVAIGLPME